MAFNGPGDDEAIGGGFATGGGGGIIGAVIGAGAGLYDSYQNRKTSKENTQRTIAAQKAEAELAYQRSMEMWNMQNAYNTPEAQMQRFIEAGLNPHLIYGQGSPGNTAVSTPQYQAPNLQYKYEAPTYGAALQSILPTLMAVGSWMQSMRKSEVDINRGVTETDRSRQMIEYLLSRHPQLLKEGENRLSLFPYQKDMQRSMTEKAYLTLADLDADYRYKYGESLWSELRHDSRVPTGSSPGGLKALQFLQEQSKTKLLDAKSSWSDFNITDPQAIMQLVLSGVMGLAGQTLRLSTHRSPKVTHEVEEQMRSGRVRTRRRTYQR